MSRWPAKETMQERILETADRLFYHQGIRAVGVDAIAAEIGISKRTLYNYYPSKDALIVAYLARRCIPLALSDAPPAEQILGAFDRLEALVASGKFRGCPFVNAVAELGEPTHEANKIAVAFKEQRRVWFRDLLVRLQVPDPESLATQLAILVDGAIAGALVRGDPGMACAAKDAARVLLASAVASAAITIRPYADDDARAVRELFITVNRLLAPPELRESFERYIDRSLAEEIDRISAYYGERDGGFWVVLKGGDIVGMFGLEPAGEDAMELRRMYVHPACRRAGIARRMLQCAEAECRRRKAGKLELSTSELQPAALAFYRSAGYRLVREESVEAASNKTLGGGIRRYYFEKALTG